MSRPKVLVLFAGGMGSAWGYAQAGFDVTAVDVHQRQDLPPLGEHVRFVKADALDLLADIDYLRTFDLLDGGPPCQTLTRLTKLRDAQGKGIPWMSWSALVEAIPPPYTRYIAGHFLRAG